MKLMLAAFGTCRNARAYCAIVDVDKERITRYCKDFDEYKKSHDDVRCFTYDYNVLFYNADDSEHLPKALELHYDDQEWVILSDEIVEKAFKYKPYPAEYTRMLVDGDFVYWQGCLEKDDETAETVFLTRDKLFTLLD